MARNINKKDKKSKRVGFKTKLIVAFLSIIAILLISSIISVFEFSSMSSFVSDQISEDISRINAVNSLSSELERYNRDILTVIGIDELAEQPEFDIDVFASKCDSLSASFTDPAIKSLPDSIKSSFFKYMQVSYELQDVLRSDFISSRGWYFERLQPFYNDVRLDIHRLNSCIYESLGTNSESFDTSFYRSIMPGMVAVGAGILLTIMLLFFLLSNYVNPICKMTESLKNYLAMGRKYNVEVDSDDQLKELNDGITELCSSNTALTKRINTLKHSNERKVNQ